MLEMLPLVESKAHCWSLSIYRREHTALVAFWHCCFVRVPHLPWRNRSVKFLYWYHRDSSKSVSAEMLDVKIEARTNLARTEMCECRSDLILDWDKQLEYVRVHLARVVEHDVLPRQLQQHGVVEELVDGDVLRQSLPPPRFHHELSRLKTKWVRFW